LQQEKSDVIRRVKARKAELEAELERVKLTLWETTIEHGGLTHVLQGFQEQERQALGQGQQVLATIDNTQG